MKLAEIPRGTILRHKASGASYVLDTNYGNSLIAHNSRLIGEHTISEYEVVDQYGHVSEVDGDRPRTEVEIRTVSCPACGRLFRVAQTIDFVIGPSRLKRWRSLDSDHGVKNAGFPDGLGDPLPIVDVCLVPK